MVCDVNLFEFIFVSLYSKLILFTIIHQKNYKIERVEGVSQNDKNTTDFHILGYFSNSKNCSFLEAMSGGTVLNN